MIEPRQIRAARALLNWSQSDLATASGVAVSSIKNIENSLTVARKDTIDDIRHALERAGVEFTAGGGVQPKRPEVQIHTGREAFKHFFDHVYAEVQKGGDICISGMVENKITEVLGDYAPFHRNRMADLKDRVKVRCLLIDGDVNFAASEYCEYRWTDKEFIESTLFYVFNNEVAIITFLEDDEAYIINFKVPKLAQFYKNLFEKLWKDARVPPQIQKLIKIG